jgi:import inner membrane translocase subunit TIM16
VQFGKRMKEDEARQILLVEDDVTMEDLNERFSKLFEKNEGGSFYLQSKIYRAHEVLEAPLLEAQVAAEEAAAAAGGGDGKDGDAATAVGDKDAAVTAARGDGDV